MQKFISITLIVGLGYFSIVVFYSTGAHVAGMPGATTGPVPIVRMYGVTMEGNSVMAHIHGFAPFFYVPAPANFKASDCGVFRVCMLSWHQLSIFINHRIF